MKNFLANKKIGYYLVAVDIILAIFLGIFFFATYKEFAPGYGGIGMAQNAYANIPEVIGLFILLGAVVDAVLLVLPEYAWIHIFAIGAYCVSLMKQVYCIPNLIADEINDVHYQGGSFPLNLAWLIIQIVIIVLAIAAIFIGFIRQEDEEVLKKEKIAGKKLIKVSAGGVAVVVAFALVMISYGSIAKNVKKGTANVDVAPTFAERVKARVAEFEDQVVDYDFDPADFKLTEAENEYSNNKSAISGKVGSYSETQERTDTDGNPIHKVYTFEGATAEGWQGDYSLKIVRITLWEDGLYNGNANGNGLNGYWYNVDEYGEDCLMLISSDGSNDMVGNKLTGEGSYYEWFVDVKASYNGGRLIKGNGLRYHPLIGMFVDTGSEDIPQYKVGSDFDRSEWTCMQVRNNLVAGSIFNADNDVTWSTPNMNEVGKQTVTARWKVNKLAENAIEEGSNYYYEAEVEIEIVEQLLTL